MQSEIQGKLSAHINETINNQKVIKAFSYEQRAEEKFCAIDADLHTSGIKAQFNSSLANPSTRFVNGLVYASVGIFGSICAIRGLISIGQVSSISIPNLLMRFRALSVKFRRPLPPPIGYLSFWMNRKKFQMAIRSSINRNLAGAWQWSMSPSPILRIAS